MGRDRGEFSASFRSCLNLKGCLEKEWSPGYELELERSLREPSPARRDRTRPFPPASQLLLTLLSSSFFSQSQQPSFSRIPITLPLSHTSQHPHPSTTPRPPSGNPSPPRPSVLLLLLPHLPSPPNQSRKSSRPALELKYQC